MRRLEVQIAAHGMRPAMLRHASEETRAAAAAVIADDAVPVEQRRELLRVIADAKLEGDRLALRRDERHAVLRAVRDGARVDEARERLQEALAAQRDADMAKLAESAIPRSGRNIILGHAAAMLRTRELLAAMATCRTLRGMLPATVYALDGFDPEKTTDTTVTSTTRQFPNIKSIDLGGCHNLTNAAINVLAARCPQLQSLNVGCVTSLDARARARLTRLVFQVLPQADGRVHRRDRASLPAAPVAQRRVRRLSRCARARAAYSARVSGVAAS